MEIISSEIKNINNKENTFHLVLRISNKNNKHQKNEGCERKWTERNNKKSSEEIIKMIDQKINFLKQKSNEMQQNEERRQRIENKIMRLSEKKSRIENKINNKTICNQEDGSFEMKNDGRRCNKFSHNKERNFEKFENKDNKGEWIKRKVECIERRINKLKDLLNQQLPQQKKERIEMKIEFLSKKFSHFQQRREVVTENNIETTNSNNIEKRERCKQQKFHSKEFLGGRIEGLKQRKEKIENKMNELGNSNDFLKGKLSHKLERIEKRINWINQKIISL